MAVGSDLMLLQSDDRYRLLVESVQDYGIFMLTPQGHVATWNRGAEHIKGYGSDEIIGKHHSVFHEEEDVRAGTCERGLAEAQAQGRSEDRGWRLRKGGERFLAHVVITALKDPAANLVGFAAIIRALARSNEVGSENRRLVARLHEGAMRRRRLLDKFVSVFGHDLRNPLGALHLGVALIRRHVDAASPVARVLDRMDASSARMTKMIDQILDLTRIQLAPGLVLAPKVAGLDALLEKVRERQLALHPHQDIELDCEEARGNWDFERLEGVLSTLVANAVQHSAGRPVAVRSRVSGERVEVSVHNHGAPIPAAVQAQLFDPFGRDGRGGRAATTEGLGLGLYVAREIMRAHGGELEVASSEEKGTIFRAILPLH